MFAWTSVLYGVVMSLIDIGMMGLVKKISLTASTASTASSSRLLLHMILPTMLYALEPWVFLSAMKYESMTVMNIVWNLVSNILVTGFGILYFGEKIKGIRLAGFVLAIISLVMLGQT